MVLRRGLISSEQGNREVYIKKPSGASLGLICLEDHSIGCAEISALKAEPRKANHLEFQKHVLGDKNSQSTSLAIDVEEGCSEGDPLDV